MELIKIDNIAITTDTYKEHSDFLMASKLKKSLIKYGQLKNIVVHREKKDEYTLVEGSAILATMKELGHQKIWCKVITESEYEEIKARIILNDTLYPIDFTELAKTINHVRKIMPFSDHLNDLPYDRHQIDKFKHIFDFDWDQFEEEKKTMIDPNQISIWDVITE
jgi:hypothetical protein